MKCRGKLWEEVLNFPISSHERKNNSFHLTRKSRCLEMRQEIRLIESLVDGATWFSHIPQEYQDIYEALFQESLLLGVDAREKLKVEKDVTRTFSLFKATGCDLEFKHCDEENVMRLRLVLLAISKERGYCQGYNFLAGLFLLISDSPTKAFVLLSFLLKHRYLEILFDSKCSSLVEYIKVFEKKLRAHNRPLYRHFKKVGFSSVCFAVEWFTTCFVVTSPSTLAYCTLDLIFSGFSNALIRVGLAVLQVLTPKLLEASYEDLQFNLRTYVRGVSPADVMKIVIWYDYPVFSGDILETMTLNLDLMNPDQEFINTLRFSELRPHEDDNSILFESSILSDPLSAPSFSPLSVQSIKKEKRRSKYRYHKPCWYSQQKYGLFYHHLLKWHLRKQYYRAHGRERLLWNDNTWESSDFFSGFGLVTFVDPLLMDIIKNNFEQEINPLSSEDTQINLECENNPLELSFSMENFREKVLHEHDNGRLFVMEFYYSHFVNDRFNLFSSTKCSNFYECDESIHCEIHPFIQSIFLALPLHKYHDAFEFPRKENDKKKSRSSRRKLIFLSRKRNLRSRNRHIKIRNDHSGWKSINNQCSLSWPNGRRRHSVFTLQSCDSNNRLAYYSHQKSPLFQTNGYSNCFTEVANNYVCLVHSNGFCHENSDSSISLESGNLSTEAEEDSSIAKDPWILLSLDKKDSSERLIWTKTDQRGGMNDNISREEMNSEDRCFNDWLDRVIGEYYSSSGKCDNSLIFPCSKLTSKEKECVSSSAPSFIRSLSSAVSFYTSNRKRKLYSRRNRDWLCSKNVLNNGDSCQEEQWEALESSSPFSSSSSLSPSVTSGKIPTWSWNKISNIWKSKGEDNRLITNTSEIQSAKEQECLESSLDQNSSQVRSDRSDSIVSIDERRNRKSLDMSTIFSRFQSNTLDKSNNNFTRNKSQSTGLSINDDIANFSRISNIEVSVMDELDADNEWDANVSKKTRPSCFVPWMKHFNLSLSKKKPIKVLDGNGHNSFSPYSREKNSSIKRKTNVNLGVIDDQEVKIRMTHSYQHCVENYDNDWFENSHYWASEDEDEYFSRCHVSLERGQQQSS